MLLELRRGEAGADVAEGVGVEGEEGAALAEAGVEGHAEGEEHVFELPVREGSEGGVVVEREVLDEERGDEAGAEGVDAEGHGAGEGVPDLLLHDADERLGVVAVERFGARGSVECVARVLVDRGGAEGARAHEVGDGLAPEEPLLLCEAHDDCRAAHAEERDAEREPVHVAEHGRDVRGCLLRVQQHRSRQTRAEIVLDEVHQVDELFPRVVDDLGGHELVDEVNGPQELMALARTRAARLRLPRDARRAPGRERHAGRLANRREGPADICTPAVGASHVWH